MFGCTDLKVYLENASQIQANEEDIVPTFTNITCVLIYIIITIYRALSYLVRDKKISKDSELYRNMIVLIQRLLVALSPFELESSTSINHFERLPRDIKIQVLKSLDPSSLSLVGETCKELHDLSLQVQFISSN
jgi:hypothetical protein